MGKRMKIIVETVAIMVRAARPGSPWPGRAAPAGPVIPRRSLSLSLCDTVCVSGSPVRASIRLRLSQSHPLACPVRRCPAARSRSRSRSRPAKSPLLLAAPAAACHQ